MFQSGFLAAGSDGKKRRKFLEACGRMKDPASPMLVSLQNAPIRLFSVNVSPKRSGRLPGTDDHTEGQSPDKAFECPQVFLL